LAPKKERIKERLLLLNSERLSAEKVNSRSSFVRYCSTCKNSLDFLECTQKDNQRKSWAIWKARDEDDIEKAIKFLDAREESSSDVIRSEDMPRLSSISIESVIPLQKSKADLNQSIFNLASVHSSQDSSRNSIDFLHKSKPALNLAPKKERIRERLKIINQERNSAEQSDNDLTRGSLVRTCSTCKNSLDFLECTQENNQRKSWAIWKARDENDIEKALLRLDVNKSSDSVDIVLSSDDTPLFDSARDTSDGKKLHTSTASLNLKVDEVKKERIIARLKQLNEERGSTADPSSERIRTNADLRDQSDPDIELRGCSTCANSLEMLVCSNDKNQRKSIAKWQARDEEDVEKAYDTLKSRNYGLNLNKTTEVNITYASSNSSGDDTLPLHKADADINLKIKNEREREQLSANSNKQVEDEDGQLTRSCSTCGSLHPLEEEDAQAECHQNGEDAVNKEKEDGIKLPLLHR